MSQKIRRTLLLVLFLLFPITIWYFSPYLILQAASEHIMNGSFLVFAAMLVLSMFFGRVWCAFFARQAACRSACSASTTNQQSKASGTGSKM